MGALRRLNLVMKKLIPLFLLLFAAPAFGAAAAYDVIISQRPDSGTGPNVERLITPTANYVMGFDASKHPVAVAPSTGTVTSVAASVPSFLSISGSPVTSSGTLAITYSGTALPAANGGTGLTSLGSGVATWLGTPSWTNFLSAITGATPFASTTKADVLEAALFAADAGSTDAYAITLSPGITGYVTGAHYRFKANTANTGAATIDINGQGAKTIKKVAGGITTDLADNDIRSGQWVDLVYDGTNMQMQSTLGNAASGGSGDMLLGTAQTVTAAKTFNAGTLKIASGGDLVDANGNELFKFTATASAVNEFTLANAATGASPTFTASGGDTNIGMNFTLKGSGNFIVNGAASNNNSLIMNAAASQSPAFVWNQNGTGQMYSSMAIATDGGIAGSVSGDWVFVHQQSKKIMFSANNGTTAHFYVAGDNIKFQPTSGNDLYLDFNTPNTTKNILFNLRANGSGKAEFGLAGATNQYVPGTAQFDMFFRSAGSMWFSSDQGSSAAGRFVNSTGQFLLLKNITSTSTTTGTEVITGGLGVSENINAGGDIATQTIGKTIKVKSGSNAKAGTFTLVAGTATVSNTSVTANSVIVMTLKTAGGSITVAPYVSAITASTSFVVTAGGSDTSTYNYVILEVN